MLPRLTPFKVREIGHEQVAVGTQCPFCLQDNPEIEMTLDSWYGIRDRKIQALTVVDGSTEKAEWLISGTCTPCWDRMFSPNYPESEEEEYDIVAMDEKAKVIPLDMFRPVKED